jgi:hypothetical protein
VRRKHKTATDEDLLTPLTELEAGEHARAEMWREKANELVALSQVRAERLTALEEALEKCPPAVIESAIVIETLRGQDAVRPYREFSPAMRNHLVIATNALREAAGALAHADRC